MLHIRADGNPTIGTGHVMRCLAIADAMKARGEETRFLVADNHMESVLAKRGYAVIVLDSDWDSLEPEADELVSLLQQHNIRKVLIDSYAVTPAYLSQLSKAAYVAYLDDINAFHYTCHMLINYNCYAHKRAYRAQYPGTQLLIGCRYAPVREEFQNIPRRVVRRDVKSVLVTTGGSDSRNIAGQLVTRAKKTPELEDLEFHIVAGPFNPYTEDLKHLARELDGVVIHSSLPAISRRQPTANQQSIVNRQATAANQQAATSASIPIPIPPTPTMSQLMLDCDIAVSAGGSTLYELCACGTPAVIFALADNQLDGVEGFGKELMINAGDVRENESLCLQKMLKGLQQLRTDYPRRLKLAEEMQTLVDGQGALRIAEALCSV